MVSNIGIACIFQLSERGFGTTTATTIKIDRCIFI